MNEEIIKKLTEIETKLALIQIDYMTYTMSKDLNEPILMIRKLKETVDNFSIKTE